MEHIIKCKFDVGDLVYPIWFVDKKCECCGELVPDRSTIQVLPPCKVYALTYASHSVFTELREYTKGITYDLERQSVPFKSAEQWIFATYEEATQECIKRNNKLNIDKALKGL